MPLQCLTHPHPPPWLHPSAADTRAEGANRDSSKADAAADERPAAKREHGSTREAAADKAAAAEAGPELPAEATAVPLPSRPITGEL